MLAGHYKIKSQGYWFESNRGSIFAGQRAYRLLLTDKLSSALITSASGTGS
jgi:hypothetical protein